MDNTSSVDHIIAQILKFKTTTEEREHTDTEDAWELFNWILEELNKIKG